MAKEFGAKFVVYNLFFMGFWGENQRSFPGTIHGFLALVLLISGASGELFKKEGDFGRIIKTDNWKMEKLRIQVGGKQFTATLNNTETAQAFLKLLPLTIKMKELNRNEKYGELPTNLPTKNYVPERIEAGDLLLYGSNVVVLFYESFTTTYSYSSIGKIEEVKGLKEALGKGDVELRFERE